jgi:BCD family chlorophyll transporter-like MFS transporter
MSDPQPNLSTARNIKIGFFHLGSGMADVITTGVWNRIMISDLGFSATAVGLLVALRYFLAPLGIWAGRMSDTHVIGGYRRLFWVWLGRGVMAVSIAALGAITAHLARGNPADFAAWGIIALSLLLFSLGYAFSGSTFLALIYDRAPEHQRGRAVGIVWTFLLLGFTVGGVFFGMLLPASDAHTEGTVGALKFTPETIFNLFLIGALVMGGLWFFSVLGEERRNAAVGSRQEDREQPSSLKADLKLAWGERQTRYFFWYLALSMLFAFTQDLILEPFAADVFDMSASTTSRFAAYWGSMAILGTVVFLVLSRRVKWLTNTVMNYLGVGTLVATFALLALSSFAEIRPLVTPALILLGIGLGIWNVGTLGLMMDMSPFGKAGTFLGFWTLVVTFARGGGVAGGGILRDLALQIGGTFTFAYGAAFAIGALGLLASIYALSQVNVRAYKQAHQVEEARDTAKLLAGAMD